MEIQNRPEYSAKAKSSLLSITGLIGVLASLSEHKVSKAEFADALARGYDPNSVMLYDGSSEGMADPICNADPVQGYNARGDAICGLCNSRFWDDPNATVLRGVPADRVMVTKEDANELARWLWARFFDTTPPKNDAFTLCGRSEQRTESQADIDPADLPEELDAANMAYRAVLNGYGEKSSTFKNRLQGYLEKEYPHLTSEAVSRISTVANPDKTTGRKKRDKE